MDTNQPIIQRGNFIKGGESAIQIEDEEADKIDDFVHEIENNMLTHTYKGRTSSSKEKSARKDNELRNFLIKEGQNKVRIPLDPL